MSKYVLDPDLRARLNGLNEQIELCDEAGKTLGRFVPEEEYRQLFYAALAKECPYSPAELERMHNQQDGKSLREFWQEMGVA